jgi:hypothetical protein
MKTILIFGNGNLSFDNFLKEYVVYLDKLNFDECEFIVGDFRGTDTLILEYLKTKTMKVNVYHIGEQPRYFPDTFKMQTSYWKIVGNFKSDKARDAAMIQHCTHFLGIDYNSDETRKSGTAKNIEKCLQQGKIDLRNL